MVGYEQRRSEITEKIEELRRRLGGRAVSSVVSSADGNAPAQRRTMSAAARKRIADAQRKRWAVFHKSQKPAALTKVLSVKKAPTKRRMSAAGRKRIAEATKKRWAAFRAKKAQSSSPGKTKPAE